MLRDVILGLLAADPTLEPRDILVMCPDIETFAPLISATFGVGAELLDEDGAERGPVSPASLLRVRLADRSLRQTNPVMSVAATLLELVDGRMTASEVLDLAAAAPVRRRFGFDDDDLGRLTEWVTEAQVRWGLDAAHRAAFKLEAFGQNTWEAGLDRLLLGVAMAEGPASGDAAAQPGGGGWVGLALAARRCRQHRHRAGRPACRAGRAAARRRRCAAGPADASRSGSAGLPRRSSR